MKKQYTIANGLVMYDQGQYDHFQRVCNILKYYHIYFDQSSLGSGKTFVALAVCLFFNLKLFVVCPVSSTYMWKKLADEYKVDILDIVSYARLRGQCMTKKLKHPYLHRYSFNDDTNKKSQITYEATEMFKQQCSEGLMVIVDEGHNFKNDGLQCRSVQALFDAVRGSQYARAGVLSGSLIDQIPMCVNMLRTLGYYGERSRKLYFYNVGTRRHDYTGYQEIIENCRRMDPQTTKELELEFLPEGGGNHGASAKQRSLLKTIHTNVYTLFTHVVLEKCSSSMPDPKLPADLKNGFYIILSEPMKQLAKESMFNIQKATGYKMTRTGQASIQWRKKSLDVITKSLANYEMSLLEICVRQTLSWLINNPQGKVVIMASYTRSLMLLYHQLSKYYEAALFYGRMNSVAREQTEKRFQTDPSLRILISNIQCGGQGINLHDTSQGGKCPRIEFILPTYKLLSLYQACGRVVRRGMTSTGTVRIVYSSEYPLDNVFDAIARKSNVLMDINQRGAGGTRRLYPGEFEKYIETMEEIDAYDGEIKKFITAQIKAPFQTYVPATEPVELIKEEESEDDEDEKEDDEVLSDDDDEDN
jgi:hypothetical protein